MSRSLSPKVLRELRGLLAALDMQTGGHEPARRFIASIDAALKPKRAVRAARKVQEKKRATRREKVAELRARLMKRSSGVCEVGYCANPAAEMDHFHAGANRRALESEAGCWMLCRAHHRAKHASVPSRQWWLEAFLANSTLSGHYAEPQRKAQAELESLQMQGRAT